MEIIKFDAIKEILIDNLNSKMLVPVIGGGFTCGCKSNKGKVPSGTEYRDHMVKSVVKEGSFNKDDTDKIKQESFSSVSSMYQKIISKEKQKEYYSDYFTHVCLDDEKKQFLKIDWDYIYTLNIDDAIENNSEYKCVLYANRTIQDDIFDNQKCIIKLHGDVKDIISYADSNSEIMAQEQYVSSITSNVCLLDKLKHDIQYQNIIFIGCGLDDEIDILECAQSRKYNRNITSKYFCTINEPSEFEKLKLDKFGVTHVIIFESYDDIYTELYDAYLKSTEVKKDDLINFKIGKCQNITSNYKKNAPYLFYGSSLVNYETNKITLPYFFISRSVTEEILFSKDLQTVNESQLSSIHLIVGGSCCGKTYILMDIASKIKNRIVYVFDSKERLSDYAFNEIINYKHSVILADENVLSINQIEKLLNNRKEIYDNDTSFFIVTNKNNRELNGLVKLMEIQGKLEENDILTITVRNKFNSEEIKKINPLLTAINVGLFSIKKTLVDNIVEVSDNLTENNTYEQAQLCFSTSKHIAALIALATEKKIYTSKAITLDILEELIQQKESASPMIDEESTWFFERSASNNSPIKYVLNAEFWVCNEFEKFAAIPKNHKKITDAYYYIVSKLIEVEGTPSLSFDKSASYKNYILFDKINRIFYPHGKGGLTLIKKIYERLNDLLSNDPNYMHQRAKCLIRIMLTMDSNSYKIDLLQEAYRYVIVSQNIFEQRFEETRNEKLKISISHVMYTGSLIQCHICHINNYKDNEYNKKAIDALYDALSSPYNSYDYAKSDILNSKNVIAKMVQHLSAHSSQFDNKTKKKLSDLLNITSNFSSCHPMALH